MELIEHGPATAEAAVNHAANTLRGRALVALNALRAGGVFTRQLEFSVYTRREQFRTRLFVDGVAVRGVGESTLAELRALGLTRPRAMFRTSRYSSSWVCVCAPVTADESAANVATWSELDYR